MGALTGEFDVVVVGGGPLGASAAANLAERGARTAVLAPAEGNGASRRYCGHGDVSRIARKWSDEPTWRLLGTRSIPRFRQIEQTSGVRFFEEIGSLLIAPPDDVRQAMADPAIDREAYETLGGGEVRQRFSYLNVGECAGVYESNDAGYFDPREFVRAQILRGRGSDLSVHDQPMIGVRRSHHGGYDVTLNDGTILRTRDALLAAGSYSRFEAMGDVRDRLTIYGRTVALLEVDTAARQQLRDMPTMRLQLPPFGMYVVPPIEYPDGKYYLKVGGGPRTEVLTSRAALDAWSASDGDAAVVEMLTARAREILPDIEPVSVRHQTCNIAAPMSGRPYIARSPDGIAVLTGGSGAGAKSGDELGRLAAAMILGDAKWANGYRPGAFAL